MNPASGRSYEDELCGASQPRGVAVLGDSISAHFHLPREWFNSTELSLVYPHTTLPQAMVRSTSSSLHLGEAGSYPLAMVCDNDTPDDCFILEICVVLIIEFLIYIFILLSSFQTMFFKVKISMEVFEKNNTREKKSALKKNKIRNMTNTREILFIYLLFRKHLNPFRLLWRMSSTGQSSQQ